MRPGCSHESQPNDGARTQGTPPGTGSRGGRRAAQPSRWCPGSESSGCGRRSGYSPSSLGCSSRLLPASRVPLLGAQCEENGFGVASPESPKSTFLQVVAKNSRRITLGEERDARKARRSEARLRLVLHSGGRRRDATQLPREGPGCTKKRGRPPAKGVKWKTHSAGKQPRSQAHPPPRALRPRSSSRPLLHPMPGSGSRPSGSRDRLGPEGGAARSPPAGSESAPGDVRLA